MADDARTLIEQTLAAVHESDFARALDLVSRALELEPGNANALMLRGIALSNMGRVDAATDSFRQAVTADPSNSKAYYNLATHLYQAHKQAEAYLMAQEAARLDPSHQPSHDLVRRIETERTAEPVEAPPTYGASPYQGATPLGGAGGVEFVHRLGDKWIRIAWFLAIGSFAFTVVLVIATLPEVMEVVKVAMLDPSKTPVGLSSTATALSYVGHAIGLTCLAWILVDIGHRRTSWAWLAFFMPCCCLGLQGIPMFVYLAMRKALS